MKYNFRGQLNNGDIVNIIEFKNEIAVCGNNKGSIHIDEFNNIICGTEKFKELVNIKTDSIIEKEIIKKPTAKKKNS